MGVAAMSAPYAPLALYGVAATATPVIRNIISSPLAFVADMAIGTGISKIANKISEIRTGKNIYERAQERYPNDPVKATISGMLRDPGTYVGFNTALRGKNAYKVSKNLIEAGGIKNYRIAKAITNGLDTATPVFKKPLL
jgi:Ni,Fe-hydrogenase III large subunit